VTGMLDRTVEHFTHDVLPAVVDYEIAEHALSKEFGADPTPAAWEAAGREAKRRAAQLAIAIDGLTDRCAIDLGWSKPAIRSAVAKLCLWPGTNFDWSSSMERILGAANAYRHAKLDDPKLPIASDRDVLLVGMPYGMGAYGAGKYGGAPEVMVRVKTGDQWQFLADVPPAVAGWMRFLSENGATFSAGPYIVCGVQVHPLTTHKLKNRDRGGAICADKPRWLDS
jgi:hypothetical protein